MGILKGNVPVKRYRTETVERPVEECDGNYRVHAFLPIVPDSETEVSVGWVDRDSLEFDDLKVTDAFVDESVVLLARMDTLKPPTADVKRKLDELVKAKEAEQEVPLTKREKKLLKAEVIAELRRRVLPKTRFVELEWNPDLQRLRIFTTSKGASEAVAELFVKTFGVYVDVLGPEAWAKNFLVRTLKAKQPGMSPEEANEAVASGLRTVLPDNAMMFGFGIKGEVAA